MRKLPFFIALIFFSFNAQAVFDYDESGTKKEREADSRETALEFIEEVTESISNGDLTYERSVKVVFCAAVPEGVDYSEIRSRPADESSISGFVDLDTNYHKSYLSGFNSGFKFGREREKYNSKLRATYPNPTEHQKKLAQKHADKFITPKMRECIKLGLY